MTAIPFSATWLDALELILMAALRSLLALVLR